MKNKAFFLLIIFMCILTLSAVSGSECTRIRDGVLVYPSGYLEGQPIRLGFDIFGYNFQAHLFVGYYANAFLGGDNLPPYRGNTEEYLKEHPEAEDKFYWPLRNVLLIKKWNDAFLSNKDCDHDGLLDVHYGFDSYIGSGARLTTIMIGKTNGKVWRYIEIWFAKPYEDFNCRDVGAEDMYFFCKKTKGSIPVESTFRTFGANKIRVPLNKLNLPQSFDEMLLKEMGFSVR